MSACVTCGSHLESTYCPTCGERRFDHHALSLKHFFEHAFEAFAHFDSTIIRSVKALLGDPGRLTADWSAGKRKPYLAPVQLLLVMNLFYFASHAIAPWNTLTTDLWTHMNWSTHQQIAREMVEAKLAKTGAPLEDYRKKFDAKAEILAKSLVIVMAPMLALAVFILQIGSRRYFVEHLVFALHFYAFLLVYLGVSGPLTNLILGLMKKGGVQASAMAIDQTVSLVAIVLLVTYLAMALKTVYRQAWWLTGAKALALVVAVVYVLQAYRFLLFLITYTSVKV
ncbi:MAG: DUF3667 domain-containing protein [Bryobacteraceae bacterium]